LQVFQYLRSPADSVANQNGSESFQSTMATAEDEL
jgi:hypothetical protein